MSLQPVVISYRGRPAPSAEQLLAATRIAWNASLAIERMTGYAPRPLSAVHIRDDTTTLGTNGPIYKHPELWAKAGQTLTADGRDPSEGLYCCWLMQGSGVWVDNSGLGNPIWTQEMYNSGEWGWNERANPDAGGVCIIGQGGLDLVAGVPVKPTRRRYGEARRFNYHRAVLTCVHEVCHAAGVAHAGYTQAQHPNPMGDPSADRHRRGSVMGYGFAPDWPYINGAMTTVGMYPQEITAVRGSVHTRPSRANFTRVYPADRQRIAAGDAAVLTAIAPGFVVEEYGVTPR